MSGPWSAEQREWLEALGHPALVLGNGAGRDPVEADGDKSSPAASSGLTATPAARVGASVEGNSVGTPLYRALLKATGRTGAEAEQVLRKLGVGVADRMDTAAKRALWPRLRQLRGQRPA